LTEQLPGKGRPGGLFEITEQTRQAIDDLQHRHARDARKNEKTREIRAHDPLSVSALPTRGTST
jgi:hypothetical protein